MFRTLLPVALLALLAAGCGGKQEPKSAEVPVPVVAETAATQTITDFVSTFGNVEAQVRSDVGSILPGRIVTMTRDVGELIPGRSDQPGGGDAALLARLDTSVLEAEARQLDAQIALSQANLTLAQKNLQRSEQLFKQGSGTESQLDQVRAASEVAAAQVQSDKAARAAVQVRLDQSSIYSPTDAVVIRKYANVGDVVNPGQPVYLLECIRDLKINAVVPERDVPAVQPGKAAEITFDALPGRSFTGEIYALIPSGDPLSHSFTAEIRFRNHTKAGPLPAELPPGLTPDQLLIKPGMFARVRILKYSKADAAVIPVRCVVEDGDKAFVYRIIHEEIGRATPETDRAKKVPIRTGITMDLLIEVLDGLKPGDKVVGRGVENMSEGQPVRIIQTGGETPNAERPPAVSSDQ